MSKPVFSRRWRPAVLISALLVGPGAAAGELNAPAGSDHPASAQFTLMDLWSRLSNGNPGELRAGAFVPPATGPTAGTMYSLNEIMAIMPALDPAGATAAQVLAGQTFWGLRADGWGRLTGTMTNVGQQTITPGTTEQTIAQGYHDGTGTVAGDADLAAGNIKSGVTIFGVEGTFEMSPCSCDCTGCAIWDAAGGGTRWCDNGNGTVTDLLGANVGAKTTGRCLVWLKDAG